MNSGDAPEPSIQADGSRGLSTAGTANLARQTAAHKWQRVLRALVDRPHTSRELERDPVFDHCAHSTAAELRKRGVAIHTDMVEIVGYAGLPAHVARYSLTPDGLAAAIKLLGNQ